MEKGFKKFKITDLIFFKWVSKMRSATFIIFSQQIISGKLLLVLI